MAITVSNALEAAALRAKARRLYLQIQSRSDLSCGVALTDFIRPDVPRAVEEFNETMKRLAEIDPEAAALLKKEGPLT